MIRFAIQGLLFSFFLGSLWTASYGYATEINFDGVEIAGGFEGDLTGISHISDPNPKFFGGDETFGDFLYLDPSRPFPITGHDRPIATGELRDDKTPSKKGEKRALVSDKDDQNKGWSKRGDGEERWVYYKEYDGLGGYKYRLRRERRETIQHKDGSVTKTSEFENFDTSDDPSKPGKSLGFKGSRTEIHGKDGSTTIKTKLDYGKSGSIETTSESPEGKKGLTFKTTVEKTPSGKIETTKTTVYPDGSETPGHTKGIQ